MQHPHGVGRPQGLGGAVALIAVTSLLLSALHRVIQFAIYSVNGGPAATLAGFADRVAHEFPALFAPALLMLCTIEPVRRRGPDHGWRRVAAVGASVVVAALLANAFRTAMDLMHAVPGDDETWLSLSQVWLPRFLSIGALLTAVGEFYREEVRSLEAMHAAEADRAALEQQTLQARLKTLEAQIEPHFLFNTLANLRRLYETDKVAGAAMLEALMRYLQSALPSMRADRATLAREADLVRAYLDLQQVRMGRRLAYDIDIEPALRGAAIPPMMLLTLVENAIKHGLAPQREGGRVDVVARMEGSRIRLDVADTGRGFGSGTSGGGTGLANIRARLTTMFGNAADLTLMAREPRGLLATIRLPAAATEPME